VVTSPIKDLRERKVLTHSKDPRERSAVNPRRDPKLKVKTKISLRKLLTG
jgi:hypothetical protein